MSMGNNEQGKTGHDSAVSGLVSKERRSKTMHHLASGGC